MLKFLNYNLNFIYLTFYATSLTARQRPGGASDGGVEPGRLGSAAVGRAFEALPSEASRVRCRRKCPGYAAVGSVPGTLPY